MAKFHQNRRIRRIHQIRRFVGTPILSSIDLWQNYVKITILAEFVGFVKIATSSVPPSRAQSLFGEISSKSLLRLYPYLELNRSLAKFRQNRHSRQIRRIRQNRRFVGTPIFSSIDLRQNFVKIAILAEFAKITASLVPPSRAESLFGEIRQNRHSR